MPKLKVVEYTIFEIHGGSAQSPHPLVEGVGTKYLRTVRVIIRFNPQNAKGGVPKYLHNISDFPNKLSGISRLKPGLHMR